MSRGEAVSPLRMHPSAWLVVGVYIVLAILYSVVTPLFEAPDEVWHFRFITHVADTATLPTQNPADSGPWQQEGSQPPLYYLLAAPFVAPVDMSDVEQIAQKNPHAAVGRAGADGNVNFVVHTSREAFPWSGATLAAHIARFVSVLLGAATVFLTYLLALEVVGRADLSSRRLALGAALLVALNPQFLFISGAINNDNLIVALATLTLVLLLRLVNRGVTPRRLIGLGIVLGLAALSKLSGLGLWGLAGLVLLICALKPDHAPRTTHHAGPLTTLIRWSLTVFGPATLIAGWWYVRNWMLYGDPTGLNVMLEIFGGRSEPVSPLQLVREFQGLRWSFWGVFGWFNVLPPAWIHRFFDGLSLLGLLGLLMFLGRHLRERDWPTLGRLATLVVWLGITIVGLGRWTMMTSATQGRLLFPAISVIALLLFVGLATLVPKRYRAWLPATVGVLLGAIAVYVAVGVIRPAYAAPPALSAEQIASIPHPLDDTVFGEKIALAGYDVTPQTLQPGESLTVTLYWRGLKPIDKNYSVFIHLISENEVILSQRDSYPGRGNAPTSDWRPGVVFEDTYRLSVPATAGAPQSAWIGLGLYNANARGRLRLPDGTERFPLATVRLVPAESEAGIPNPVDFNLAGKVKLVGFELPARSVQPGETIELALYWQAVTEMERNYTVFTQLLGDDFNIWAQDDGQPLDGGYPTSRWVPGEIIRDTRRLTVKPDTPAGVYHLEVGMYLLETGGRLHRTDQPTADSIRLAGIRVVWVH